MKIRVEVDTSEYHWWQNEPIASCLPSVTESEHGTAAFYTAIRNQDRRKGQS